MTTVREVNAALKALGIKERLRRGSGSGYFYFFGGAAHTWPRTAIYTVSLAGLSVEDVLAERSTMSGTKSQQQWGNARLTEPEPRPPVFQIFSRITRPKNISCAGSARPTPGSRRLGTQRCQFRRRAF